MRRTLTVILASDVAEYSRLVAEHEEETITRFREASVFFTDLVKKHQGSVFNTAGDAILAKFDSAVDAMRCLPPSDQRIRFRRAYRLLY